MILSGTHRQTEVVLVFLVKFSCEVFCGGFRELALLVQNVNNSCLFCFNKGCNLKKPLTYVLKNTIFPHGYSSYTRNELWSRNTHFFLVLLNLIQVLVFNACLLGLSESVSLSVRISGFVSLQKGVG